MLCEVLNRETNGLRLCDLYNVRQVSKNFRAAALDIVRTCDQCKTAFPLHETCRECTSNPSIEGQGSLPELPAHP